MTTQYRTPVKIKALRFAVIGLGATLVHILVALVCLKVAGVHPMVANGVAFIIANPVSYFANTIWSFERSATPQNMARFISASILGLVLSVAISGIASAAGLPDVIGLALVIISLPPLTFLTHLLWTYR